MKRYRIVYLLFALQTRKYLKENLMKLLIPSDRRILITSVISVERPKPLSSSIPYIVATI